MIRAAAFALSLLLPGIAVAQTDAAGQAQKAAVDLQTAIGAMENATGGKDRVAALSRTIRAYEEGLDALREGLRQATIRTSALQMQLDAKRDSVSQLVGVLASMPSDPGPLLLLHPAGPLGMARSGMMLTEVTPALQAEAEKLRSELEELQDLQSIQAQAATTLSEGLRAAQDARTALSQAISDRTDLPKRFVDNPDALRSLLQNADTLDAVAAGMVVDDKDADQNFDSAKGTLPLPVIGTVIRKPGEADARGVRRPGILLATRPRALVTAPWPATIRYRGPLLDYGNVMILEPGNGYLLILAGLETVYGDVGDVVPAGEALGLMGGPEATAGEFLVTNAEGSGVGGSETLYLELRQGADPVDPTEWFAGTRE